MRRPQVIPWRIAHRGARDQAPENTRSAFERALQFPIDGIELDVQMSADGVVVLFHDATLQRITGRQTHIAELTRAQLEALDWGLWFHPDFSREPMLSLERTLSLFGPRTRLLIEIKSSPAERLSGHTERLTRQVVRLLADMSSTIPADHIHILSFDGQALQLAHQLAPQWRYVLNAPELQPNRITALAGVQIDHLWAIDVHIGRLSAPLVEWARARGLRIFTYTCNDARQAQKALDLGADAILTDRPGWLTEFLKNGGLN